MINTRRRLRFPGFHVYRACVTLIKTEAYIRLYLNAFSMDKYRGSYMATKQAKKCLRMLPIKIVALWKNIFYFQDQISFCKKWSLIVFDHV